MHNKSKQYFTLVELMVIIAIISVLTSMLITTMKNLKEKEKTITCSNRLKNVASAFFEHQTDNRYIPAPNDDIDSGGKYTTSTVWHYAIGQYFGWNFQAGEVANNSWFLSEEDDQLRCPGADPESTPMYRPGGVVRGQIYGYGMNILIPPSSLGRTNGATPGATRRNLMRVPDPAEIPMITDARTFHLGTDSSLSRSNPRDFYQFDRVRHEQGVNILNCDGSIQWYSEEDSFDEYTQKGNAYWGMGR